MLSASNKVNFYNEFNDYSIKPDKLIEGLKPEFYPKDPPEISLPLAIPSIIQRIYKNLVPYVTHTEITLYTLIDFSYYRLEKICECLGYELCDYNELDLSALEELLAEKSNTEPSKKRKMVSSSAPSKKRRRNPLPSSLEGKEKLPFSVIQNLRLILQVILLKLLMGHIRRSMPHVLHRQQIRVQILQLKSFPGT